LILIINKDEESIYGGKEVNTEADNDSIRLPTPKRRKTDNVS